MSDEVKDGGSAFPSTVVDKAFDPPRMVGTHGGMTLRDWFAGQALVGLCADGAADTDTSRVVKTDDPGGGCEVKYGNTVCDACEVAPLAYQIADAMLTARERPAQ